MTKKTNHLIQITLMYVIIAIAGFVVWKYAEVKEVIMKYFLAHLGMTVVCFIFSLLKRNSSVYDAFWSVIPFYFVAFWVFLYYEVMDLTHWIAFAVVSIWSWRLTLNWMRSWRDFSHEDWRYINLAKKTGKFYPAVNFLGIHLFPTLLVFGDQLYAFRNRENPETEEILDTGLWGKMRYPNYLGEMLFWIGLLLIGLAFNSPYYTGSGALAMCLLFVFISIPMKEKRMLKKRPNFPDYQRRVPKLIPCFWKK